MAEKNGFQSCAHKDMEEAFKEEGFKEDDEYNKIVFCEGISDGIEGKKK